MSSPLTSPNLRHIHMVAVCGAGMASLAALLKDRGFRVTGSDANVYPPMSTFLEGRGIPVMEGFRPGNLAPRPDLLVVGNAVARGNPELEGALNAKIPYASMPEALRLLCLTGKTSVVVAGTHGKTTTSSMIAWGLHVMGKDPSFLIGGIPNDFGAGCRSGGGECFVVEGDEYDTAYFDKAPKFFHYRPDILVVNNVEFDHADIYPDLDAILLQFRRLVHVVPSGGLVVAGADCPNARAVTEKAFCPRVLAGLHPEAFWRAEGVVTAGGRTRFTAIAGGKTAGDVAMRVHGRHNVRNALAACAVFDHLGLPWCGVRGALESFGGVERRMTLRAEVAGVRIFDDFAHHPTAIALTLEALRADCPGARIWAVFEPRSWTCRKKTHQDTLPAAFLPADAVVLADVFRKDLLKEDERFDPAAAVARLKELGRDAWFIPAAEEIAGFLEKSLNRGDVVVVLSNGGFDGLHQRLASRLEARHEAED